MNQQPAPAEILELCLNEGSEIAWRMFVRTFQPIIASSISRVIGRYGPVNLALVDDLAQETFLRLCRDDAKLLRRFEARHELAIFGYIKVVATSVALDYFRARTADKRAAEVQAEEAAIEVPVRPTEVEDVAFLGEVDRRLLATESERDRSIFWLYYRQGYSAREIAALPGVALSQKGVESCIYRLTQLLRVSLGSSPLVFKKFEGRTQQTALGEME
jgi:RNA polymerase sigma-70 factor, ECF subfamily